MLNAFYGDDFTGTMATAENFMLSGVPTIVFTRPPSLGAVRRGFPSVEAIGIAGVARTLSGEELSREVGKAFEAMGSYEPVSYLYKVCSTFDSSPEAGNIGRAIELALERFQPAFVAVLAAAPRLGRYVVFGNLFATVGKGETHRLDRHPSLPFHPVTPMTEADLRIHLSRQTDLPCGLVTIVDVERGSGQIRRVLDREVAAGRKVVFFDCITETHRDRICRVVLDSSPGAAFFVGAHEVPLGLAAARKGRAGASGGSLVDRVGGHGRNSAPFLVLSGSCADITGDQIRWASCHGFDAVAVETGRLMVAGGAARETRRVVAQASSALSAGHPVVVHTATGPGDERIAGVRSLAGGVKAGKEGVDERIGAFLGEVARELLARTPIRRVVVAGGDTAGRVQKVLGIEALQIAASVPDPAPLSYAYSGKPEVNGIEIAFKGGQVGRPDYFEMIRSLEIAPFDRVALGRTPERS